MPPYKSTYDTMTGIVSDMINILRRDGINHSVIGVSPKSRSAKSEYTALATAYRGHLNRLSNRDYVYWANYRKREIEKEVALQSS